LHKGLGIPSEGLLGVAWQLITKRVALSIMLLEMPHLRRNALRLLSPYMGWRRITLYELLLYRMYFGQFLFDNCWPRLLLSSQSILLFEQLDNR